MKYFAILLSFVVACSLLSSSVTRAQTATTCCTNNCTACDVNCVVGDWSDWGPCNVTCGGGIQVRTRPVITAQKNNGVACPVLNDTRVCNTNLCPTEFTCTRNQTDIMLVIDTIGPATPAIDVYRNFLQTVVRGIWAQDEREFNNALNQSVQIGVVTYAATPTLRAELNFTQHADIYTLFGASGIAYAAGNRNTGAAIEVAVNQLLFGRGARANAKKYIILFTFSVAFDAVAPGCTKAKRAGIEIVGVGIEQNNLVTYTNTNSNQANELERVVSLPLQTHYVPVGYLGGSTSSFVNLNSDNTSPALQVIRTVRGDKGDSCHVLGDNHITTFDGNSYSFPASGEYWLVTPCDFYANGLFQAQVRFGPCGNLDSSTSSNGQPIRANGFTGRSCARAYAFKDSSVAEVGWDPSGESVYVIIQGQLQPRQPVGGGNNPYTTGSWSITVQQRLVGGFNVTVVSPSNHRALLIFQHTNASVTARIRPYGGWSTTVTSTGLSTSASSSTDYVGLCGKYDTCPLNDFQARNETMFSTSSNSESDLYTKFGSSWAVVEGESLFTKLATGEQYSNALWTPTFSSYRGDGDYSTFIRNSCFQVPSGILLTWCLADTERSNNVISGTVAVSQSFREALWAGCNHWCDTGMFDSAVFNAAFPGSSNMCASVCRYKFTRGYFTQATDISPNYALSAVDLRGSDLPNAYFYFHPSSTRGGTFVFQRTVQRPDYCAPLQDTPLVSKNYTVQIACMTPPTISAGQNLIAYYSSYGWPLIQLNGTLTDATTIPSSGALQPKNRMVSWSIKSFVPRIGESYLPSSSFPAIFGPASLTPRFIPNAAGIWTLEMAVSDGCYVIRSTVQVESVQRCCTPQLTILPVPPFNWGTAFTSDSNLVRLNGSSFTLPQVSPSAFGFAPAGSPFPLSDRARVTPTDRKAALNYNWTVVSRGPRPNTAYTSNITVTVSRSSTVDTFVFKRTNKNVTVIAQTVTYFNDSLTSNFTSAPLPTTNWLPPNSPLNTVLKLEANFYKVTNTLVRTLNFNEVLVKSNPDDEVCTVTLTYNGAGTPSAPQIAFTPLASSSAYNTIGKQCMGYYRVDSFFYVDGFSAFCAKTDSRWIPVDCRAPPVVVATCDLYVTFNYAIRAFSPVTVNVTGSWDPFQRTINYLWSLDSTPSNSLLSSPNVNLCSQGTATTCSFTPDKRGQYKVTVYGSNGCLTDSKAHVITAKCGLDAVANAAAGTAGNTFNRNDTSAPWSLGLTGALSTSPATPYGTLNYNWFITSSPTVDPDYITVFGTGAINPTLTAPSTVTPTLNMRFGGAYGVTLTVDDGCTTSNATVALTLDCKSTVTANLVADQNSVSYNTATQSWPAFTFNGSASTAVRPTPDYVPLYLSYRWHLIAVPSTSQIVVPLSLNALPTATFTPDATGTYTVRLIVTDGCNYAKQTVDVTANCPTGGPTGQISIVYRSAPSAVWRQTMDLIGGATNGFSTVDIKSYAWKILSAPPGSTAALSATTGQTVSFVPDVADNNQYTFQLTICDNCTQCSTVTQSVQVACPTAFVANAGAAQSVTYFDNQFPKVELVGDTSTILNEVRVNYTYNWRFLDAPVGSTYKPWTNTTTVVSWLNTSSVTSNVFNTTYTNTNTKTTTAITETYFATLKNSPNNNDNLFAACFHPDVAGTYTVQLTISDGCRSSSAVTTVTAACNTAPTATLTPYPSASVQVTEEPQTVVIVDSGASDAEGDALTYAWEFAAGTQVVPVLLGRNNSVVQFVITAPGTYVLNVAISDGCSSITATTTITATSACVQYTPLSNENFVAPYSYLNPVSYSYCLVGDPASTPAFNLPTTSTAVDTKSLPGSFPLGLTNYAEYSDQYTGAYTALTQLQCDTLYRWSLVEYREEFLVSQDPCALSQFSSYADCNSALTPQTSASSSNPVEKEGWFIAIMVIIGVIIGIVIAVILFRYFGDKCQFKKDQANSAPS